MRVNNSGYRIKLTISQILKRMLEDNLKYVALKMTALQSFETSINIHTMTQCSISRLNRYENL